MNIIYLFSVFFCLTLVQLAQGKFITPVCRAGTRYCVQQNAKGTWCYTPQANRYASTTSVTSCTGIGGDHDVELQGALQSHLRQNLSIAYYNGVDNTRLGGVDYTVPSKSGIVRMCLSNSAGDGILQTLCFNVASDNSVDGFPVCVVNVGPPVVSDGCYAEKFNTTATMTSYPLATHYSSLASTIVSPFIMAIFSVILGMSTGMY